MSLNTTEQSRSNKPSSAEPTSYAYNHFLIPDTCITPPVPNPLTTISPSTSHP